MLHDAFEMVAGDTAAPVLLTCEHASQRLPPGWRWPDADARLIGSHWAYDPGAAELCRELAGAIGATAVLSRFSRLLIDPNRPLDSDTLLRRSADGEPVALNAQVTEADLRRRVATCYAPFHSAIEAALDATPREFLFSLHSFTPEYEGQRRSVEIGVLFDSQAALGHRFHAALEGLGRVTALNEPWSGLAGLMYSPELHATRRGIPALELEVRNDLCTDPSFRAELVPALAHAIRTLCLKGGQ